MESATSPPDLDKLFNAMSSVNQKMIQQVMGHTGQDPMTGYADAYQALLTLFAHDPAQWVELQGKFVQSQMALWTRLFSAQTGQPVEPAVTPDKGDKRFSAPEWNQYPLFDYIKQSYLLTSKLLVEAVEKANLDPQTKRKMVFFTKQYIDAMSPSNYALTNPEVLKMALETKGESLTEGLKNLAKDLEKGRISMTDETAFEVGVNIALTPGQVVYESELIQLIHYRPVGKRVHKRPLLFVPPCINKFYIMDLQPDNSLVRYALEQGHNLFLVSWRNITPDLQHLTWDDYIANLIRAIEVVQDIGKAEQINALGFCVGGTLLSSALAVMRARGLEPLASLTLMTVLLEFSDVGDIGVYVDRRFVEKRERQFRNGGVVPGKELAMTFSSLRANDLVWSYVVNNYLKGKTPEAFDLLYWNSDGTNLPGPMFAYYMRNTYHDNSLVKPGCLSMLGTPVDLRKVDMPAFVFAAIEDHIVPWRGAYESAKVLGGDVHFVLGASGHIAGSINSASRNRRNYWVNGELKENPDDWFRDAKFLEGSWWKPWAAWLKGHAGKQVAAPAKLGNSQYPPIEPAPGRYVKMRAV